RGHALLRQFANGLQNHALFFHARRHRHLIRSFANVCFNNLKKGGNTKRRGSEREMTRDLREINARFLLHFVSSRVYLRVISCSVSSFPCPLCPVLLILITGIVA